MAKGAYIGVSGVARKIIKGYIGIENIARKVTKAYIGVGNVARPCWSAGGGVVYYGALEKLMVSTDYHTGAEVGNYALSGGGNSYQDDVYAWDSALVRTSLSPLQYGRSDLGAGSNENYVVFGGGYASDQSQSVYTDAYNTSLVRSSPTSLVEGVRYAKGGRVGGYALIGGGAVSMGTSSKVNAYNGVLTRTVVDLSTGMQSHACGCSEYYAIFADQYAVNAFGSSLTRTACASLAVTRTGFCGAHVGNHIMFAGGWYNSARCDHVEAYDENLVKTTLSALSIGRSDMAGVSLNGFALFSGGYSGSVSAVTDAYDANLVRSTIQSISVARRRPVGIRAGNYGLIVGGNSKVVDAYQIT